MKMAIVGCEASGKTVFMCALADYYGRAAVDNPMRLKLTPENAAANSFERYQFRQMRCLRQWPPATPPERTIEIKWSLRREGKSLAEIDMLEFGGETFRAAFRDGGNGEKQEQSARELLAYLSDADFFVVLVSIKSLLADQGKATDDDFNRETEALWVTRGIVEFIRAKRPDAGIVIGLTQADKYRNELGEAGGAESFFAAHWPTVSAAARGIPVVEVASVSKTDVSGNPAEGYRTHGILPVMQAFSKHCFGDENALENGSNLKRVSHGKKPGKLFILLALGIAAAVAVVAASLGKLSFIEPEECGCEEHSRTKSAASPLPAAAAPVVIEKTVTNTIEKVVEKPVTNVVEKVKVVEKPVTKVVEKVKVVEKPITNVVEKIVEKQVTNTIEKVVEKPVTKVVEKVKVVEKPVTKVVTNTVSVVVEKQVTNVVEKIVEKQVVSAPVVSEEELQKKVPEGYRIWTDYNGRKIIAKWIGNAIDDTGITILTRYGKRIDAVLWKFSPDDQAYIRDEIKEHKDRGEIMNDGKWVRNPVLRNQ